MWKKKKLKAIPVTVGPLGTVTPEKVPSEAVKFLHLDY